MALLVCDTMFDEWLYSNERQINSVQSQSHRFHII